MPVPAFGFSIGDIVSVIDVLWKISKALKRSGGASTEYQLAIIELKNLENVLGQLECLESDPGYGNLFVNDIQRIAREIQLTLRDFLKKLEKYKDSLGPSSNRRWYQRLPRTSKWAVTFAGEVYELRTSVAAKTVSINLLLSMASMKSIPRMGSRVMRQLEGNHSESMSKAAEHRSDLITSFQGEVKRASQTSKDAFDNLSANADVTRIAVLESSQKILQSNWQIYRMLQQNVPTSPTGLLATDIKFEDALGQIQTLAYEHFRHWEIFEAFLRVHFKGKCGESKVIEGQYCILDTSRERALVTPEYWTRSINEGGTL